MTWLTPYLFCPEGAKPGHDAEPLCHAGSFSAAGARNPSHNRSLIAFAAWSGFAHAAVMGFQAWRGLIERGELIGVAVLIVIGGLLLALAPATQAATSPVTV